MHYVRNMKSLAIGSAVALFLFVAWVLAVNAVNLISLPEWLAAPV